ncbi:MAG: YdcF family protein [Bryobacterales bacterium]|nr:YdcF family protein [Bryobacterales bacterium]MBV9397683.1 YdcF family protein [Bryobacterales bacterium]
MIRVLKWGVALLVLPVVLLVTTPLADLYSQPLIVSVQPRKSDVIVLMSSGLIEPDWLTPDGAQRTWGALRLYKEQYAPYILSVGQKQALIQAGMLELAGVPRDAILVDQPANTYWSGIAVTRIMREHGWTSAVVVTSEMDVPRVRLVFAKLGMAPSFLAVPEFRKPTYFHFFRNSASDIAYHATYEYAGLIWYKLNGWI